MEIETFQHGQAGSSARCPFGHDRGDSLASELRTRTREHHRRAEFHPLQQAIVRGRIDREAYAVLTAAMRRVHEHLEHELDEAAKRDPRVAAVFAEHHRRLRHFDRDLGLLGGEAGTSEPVAAASEVRSWLRSTSCPRSGATPPIAWIGVLYVLEGSSNGGRVIAKVLREAWSLDENALRSLDPHAEETPSRWAEFRNRLDAQRLTLQERGSVVAAAAATFDGISSIMDAIESNHGIAANRCERL